MRQAEGGAKIFGVFRVKNHDFTQKNHIFSNFRGGARRVRPPLDPPLVYIKVCMYIKYDYCKNKYRTPLFRAWKRFFSDNQSHCSTYMILH